MGLNNLSSSGILLSSECWKNSLLDSYFADYRHEKKLKKDMEVNIDAAALSTHFRELQQGILFYLI